jgi:hypothetical protein
MNIVTSPNQEIAVPPAVKLLDKVHLVLYR